METAPIARFPTLMVRVAALWVAVGALFKLFAGSPNDLPPVVQEFFLGKDITFRLAIAAELLLLTTALLRPKAAWPWMVALYGVFLYVLLRLVLQVMGDQELSFGAAAFSSDASCGCFGSKIEVAPGVMMVVDGLVLILLLVSRPWRGRLGEVGPVWLPTGLALVALVVPWLVRSGEEAAQVKTDETGVAKVEEARFVEIPVRTWDGMCLYDVPFLQKFVPELDTLPIDGTYVFYRETCDHCAEHIAELAANDDMSRPFVFLRIPEEGVTDANRQVTLFPEGGHVTMVSLPEGTEYVLTTPADFQADGCIISAAREGIGR